ncbi:hypothetical protein B0T11DRAFT_71607 [Plectosphaerella cucumerina]|uniref:Uncharacterized protein n=1 Tax=Plectosphaerella cucumerina TaxID=40658 RepID=A0A8K0TR27_9PEZI|nr:hypothetical protein B0T11DRAFT_71607 [Plectosphaerella cucumerina]
MSTARSELSGTGSSSFHWHSEPCASATRHVSLCLRPVERELAPVRHPGHCRATSAHAHAWEAGDSSIVRQACPSPSHAVAPENWLQISDCVWSCNVICPSLRQRAGRRTNAAFRPRQSFGWLLLPICDSRTRGGGSVEIPRTAMVRRVNVQSNERQQYWYRPLLLFVTGSRQPNVRHNGAAVRGTQGDKRQWWHIGQCNAVMASGPRRFRFQGLFFLPLQPWFMPRSTGTNGG